ncbi:MAG: sugar transferase [Eubacterium sp.]
MKTIDKFKRIFVALITVLIVEVHTCIFWKFWIEYYNPYIERTFVFKGQLVILLLYVLLLVAFTSIYGGYKFGYLRTTEVIFSQILATIFVNTAIYLEISLLSLKMVNVIPILKMTLYDAAASTIWAVIARSAYKKLYPPRDVLLIYSDRDPDGIVRKMNSRKDKYKVRSSINVNKGFEVIKQTIDKHPAVLLCDIPAQMRNDILKYCFEKSKRAYVTPKISDIILKGSSDIHLFDTPLLLCKNRGLTYEQAIAKRICDIVVSTIVLIVFSPIMIIVAIAIKLYDGGPVFYKQKRLTLNGEVFDILKFRSMRVDSEKNGARLAGENDNRVTPIGKIIRNIHVDELPQLINILAGDMSFVGPRPERPEIAEKYMMEMPEFSFRLKVKAGLTGYAQIYGRYNTTPYDKLKLDLFYIERRSLVLDFRLIMMTIKILFQKENSQGVKKGQTTAEFTKKLEGQSILLRDDDVDEDDLDI